MTIDRRTALAGLCAFFAAGASAQPDAGDYPSRPVTVLAPFAAGGTVDIVARLIGQRLTGELKQPFLVENRGGAGGTIATRQVAKAEPDSYTLLIATSSLAIIRRSIPTSATTRARISRRSD